MSSQPETRTILKLWVACTADAESELQAIRSVVADLNDGLAPSHGLMLEVLHYTTHTHPAWGRPQSVVFEQMPREDVFVGVLRNRLGTPTGVAASGVLEEFHRAVERYDKEGQPQILFYFGRNFGPATSVVASEALTRVLEFRDSIRQRGLLAEYARTREFESLLRKHLTQVVVRWRPGHHKLPREVAPHALLSHFGRIRGQVAYAVHGDIQGFKQLNRVYGSAQCDELRDRYIVAAAAVASEHGGVVARLGGDEFTIVFEVAKDAAGFSMRFQHAVHRLAYDARVDLRVRLAISEIALPLVDSAAVHATLSIVRAFSLVGSGAQTIATHGVIEHLRETLPDGDPATLLTIHGLSIGWFDHGLIQHRGAPVRVWELVNVTIGQGPGPLHHERIARRIDKAENHVIES